MKLNEFEKRRAANLIWNAAGNYGISPGFRMYDAKGRADLYWNSIIGAAHRYYDWDRLMEFYQSFHETVDQGVYESLFWLALENSTFEKMRVERPAAAVLREHYAREISCRASRRAARAGFWRDITGRRSARIRDCRTLWTGNS